MHPSAEDFSVHRDRKLKTGVANAVISRESSGPPAVIGGAKYVCATGLPASVIYFRAFTSAYLKGRSRASSWPGNTIATVPLGAPRLEGVDLLKPRMIFHLAAVVILIAAIVAL